MIQYWFVPHNGVVLLHFQEISMEHSNTYLIIEEIISCENAIVQNYWGAEEII